MSTLTLDQRLLEVTDAQLRTLTPREEQVIRLRLGRSSSMFSDTPRIHTWEEIGRQFAVTKERARQVALKGLRRLEPKPPAPLSKTPLKGYTLAPFDCPHAHLSYAYHNHPHCQDCGTWDPAV